MGLSRDILAARHWIQTAHGEQPGVGMITQPTVLILGAGASAHVGYPLGGALVNQLCQLRGSTRLASLPGGWTSSEAEECLRQLSRSGHYSIDAFLEAFPDWAPLGKFLIAENLKNCESIDRLFPPSDSAWYQYLFNGLLAGDGSPGFEENRLSIITFNYDLRGSSLP